MDRTNQPLALDLAVLAVMADLVLMTSTHQATDPCHMTRDEVYHGTLLDCQNRHISSLPLPQGWIPDDATTILLDGNNIGRLDNDSFSTLTTRSSLRYLSLRSNSIKEIHTRIFHGFAALERLDLSGNEIKTIQPFTFAGLTSLRRLDLSYNKIDLSQDCLNGDTFHGLKHLSALELKENDNEKLPRSYSSFLFNDLENLIDLSLDTFSGALNFGSLFYTTKRPSRLYLSGGLTHIKNNSFETFASIQLDELIIDASDSFYHTEAGAFFYLKFLDKFTLRYGEQGVRGTLESLAPFINRNMTKLYFERLRCRDQSAGSFSRNSVITVYMARYLRQICVERFTLSRSDVFVIENGAFAGVWEECVRYFVVSGNPIRGEYGEMFRFETFQRLEYFEMTGTKYARSNYSAVEWRRPMCCVDVSRTSMHNKSNMEERGLFEKRGFRYKDNPPSVDLSAFDSNNTTMFSQILADNAKSFRGNNLSIHQNHLYQNRNLEMWSICVPRSLRILKLNSDSSYFTSFDFNVQFINGENLEVMHIADNGIKNFRVPIYGIPNIRILDISNNNGAILSSTFFIVFPAMTHLNMGTMQLNVDFIGDNSKTLFQRLTHLETLVLSENDLSILAKGTFSANTNLTFLDLSGNRFISVPFDLRYLPHLCWLDLRRNSIRTLSSEDITSLEAHALLVTSFNLFLDGNSFSCGCSNIRFLTWLRRTKIKLDNNRNYSCILDTGIRTTTGELPNLEAMQRACRGQTAFWLSLVLVCLMILSFMACITILKFKTQLQAFVLRSLWNPFFMKSPADYPTGVYIGYTDADTRLTCLALRPFVEEELGLSTYVRHRDLLPASDMAEAIMASINASWRVLLVVSQHYLDDPWAFFALKVATYAVQCHNPGRLVLVLTDRGHHPSLLAKLPDCILRAVREESIVTMTAGGRISYEEKEALRTALLYQG